MSTTRPSSPTPSALPSVGARVLAFVAILIGGTAGGFIGYAFVDLQVTGDSSVWAGLGALVGAIIAALGTAVVVVLTLRAMGEWNTIRARDEAAAVAAKSAAATRNVPRSMTPADSATLLELAASVAAEAAALIVEGLLRQRTTVDTKTTGTDMVTEMDRASEALILGLLTDARPNDAILGEEGTDRSGSTGVRWIVDPIDGTTNYLYGHAGFAVSIAAEVDGTVAAGVVHDPLHRDVFTAIRNGGAFRNGQPIQASSETDLSRALVATGFSYEPDRRRRQAAVLGRLIANVRDIRRMGAASVDLCSVACGRVDAYYERGLQPWDHAAGALIATEAGAIVENLSGGGPEFEFCLAAPPALFNDLKSLLIDADAVNA